MQRKINYTVAEYVRSFQLGEEKGFSFFFREYYPSLCYFSFQIIKDRSATEEIAGDALMKLWERHENFDNLQSIKSFLYTATRNASINWIRQRKRSIQREKEILYLGEETEDSIIEKLIETEIYREIFTMLNTLPPKCRKIFTMLFIEGKNYEQIAEELNLSISTIRNQKARGLMLIKQRSVFSLLVLLFLSLSI